MTGPPPAPPLPTASARRWRVILGATALLVIVALVAVLVLHPFGSTPPAGPTGGVPGVPTRVTSPASAFPSMNPPAPPADAFNVVQYGADASGHRDSTAAIRTAISKASAAAGKTVYFPSGSYLLDLNDGAATDFHLSGADAPNIVGAGRDSTVVVERVGSKAYPGLAKPKTVFKLTNVTGTIFAGLTVDAQTFNAGDALEEYGDNTTIEASRFLGATNRDTFTLRVIAVCNGSPSHHLYGVHRSNNTVRDVILSGRGTGGNADLDFSCQWNGTLSDITDVGWGAALYIDKGVTITNFMYTPGTVEKSPKGWFITDSSDIHITNFTTSGAGGIIRNHNYTTTNVTIDHEVMTKPGFFLVIGDAANVTISNSTLTGLRIEPYTATTALVVTSSSIATTVCAPQSNAVVSGLAGVRCPA